MMIEEEEEEERRRKKKWKVDALGWLTSRQDGM